MTVGLDKRVVDRVSSSILRLHAIKDAITPPSPLKSRSKKQPVGTSERTSIGPITLPSPVPLQRDRLERLIRIGNIVSIDSLQRLGDLDVGIHGLGAGIVRPWLGATGVQICVGFL